jgi:hypothetical protein
MTWRGGNEEGGRDVWQGKGGGGGSLSLTIGFGNGRLMDVFKHRRQETRLLFSSSFLRFYLEALFFWAVCPFLWPLDVDFLFMIVGFQNIIFTGYALPNKCSLAML